MAGNSPEWLLGLDVSGEPEEDGPWDDQGPVWDVTAHPQTDDMLVVCQCCGSRYECPPGMLELLIAVLDLAHVCGDRDVAHHAEAV